MSAEAIKTAVPVRGRTNTEGRLEPRSRESGANPAYWVTAGECIYGDGSRTELENSKEVRDTQPGWQPGKLPAPIQGRCDELQQAKNPTD